MVTVTEDGKYTFTVWTDGTLEILRYGSKWLTVDIGAKAIISLMAKEIEATNDAANMQDFIDDTGLDCAYMEFLGEKENNKA